MDVVSFAMCLFVALYQVHGQLENLMTSKKENQQIIVDTHNKFREMVQPTARHMLKMEWCPEAAIKAQNVADKCLAVHSSPSERQITSPISATCGENIYMSSYEADWSEVIQTWYDEKTDFKYDFGPTSKGKMVGHYTQVVWHSSYLIGCGVQKCDNLQYPYLFICLYGPQGNMMSRLYKPYDEGTPCDDCRDSCEGKLCKVQPKKKEYQKKEYKKKEYKKKEYYGFPKKYYYFYD